MKLRTVLALLMAAVILPGLFGADEEKSKEEPEVVHEATDVFALQYADVHSVYQALRAFNAKMSLDNDLQVLSVSGSRETVKAVGEAIRKIDIPAAAAKNIELTFHILIATKEAAQPAEPLPEDLKPVGEQLQRVLGFKSVSLAETALIRVRNGMKGSSYGVLGEVGSVPANYQIGFRVGVTGMGENTAVRLNQLEFDTQVQLEPGGPERRVRFITNVDIGNNQKAVVGKAGVDGKGKHLILVVTAKVL